MHQTSCTRAQPGQDKVPVPTRRPVFRGNIQEMRHYQHAKGHKLENAGDSEDTQQGSIWLSPIYNLTPQEVCLGER